MVRWLVFCLIELIPVFFGNFEGSSRVRGKTLVDMCEL